MILEPADRFAVVNVAVIDVASCEFFADWIRDQATRSPPPVAGTGPPGQFSPYTSSCWMLIRFDELDAEHAQDRNA